MENKSDSPDLDPPSTLPDSIAELLETVKPTEEAGSEEKSEPFLSGLMLPIIGLLGIAVFIAILCGLQMSQNAERGKPAKSPSIGDWRIVKGNGFEILMPGRPYRRKIQIDNEYVGEKIGVSTLQKEHGKFLIHHVEMRQLGSDSQAAISRLADTYKVPYPNQVSAKWTSASYPQLDMVRFGKTRGTDQVIRLRFIAARGKVFAIEHVMVRGIPLPEEVSREIQEFFDSFRLVD